MYCRASHCPKEDFRWDLVPYVGLGILHNDELDRQPFAVSYGCKDDTV